MPARDQYSVLEQVIFPGIIMVSAVAMALTQTIPELISHRPESPGLVNDFKPNLPAPPGLMTIKSRMWDDPLYVYGEPKEATGDLGKFRDHLGRRLCPEITGTVPKEISSPKETSLGDASGEDCCQKEATDNSGGDSPGSESTRKCPEQCQKGESKKDVLAMYVLVPGGFHVTSHEQRLRTRYAVASAMASEDFLLHTPQRMHFIDVDINVDTSGLKVEADEKGNGTAAPSACKHVVSLDVENQSPEQAALQAPSLCCWRHLLRLISNYRSPQTDTPMTTVRLPMKLYRRTRPNRDSSQTGSSQKDGCNCSVPVTPNPDNPANTARRDQNVVEIWVDRDALGNDYLDALLQIHNSVFRECPDIPVAIVGPISSDDLNAGKQVNSGKRLFPEGSRFYNCRATSYHAGNDTQETTLINICKFKRDIKTEYNLDFHSTISTDRVLAEALANEMRHRRAIGRKDGKILLISEQDTAYGRQFRETLAASLGQSTGERGIIQKHYMRGLDGTTHYFPSNQDQLNGSRDAKEQYHDTFAGPSQRDYLRRLAEEMKDLDIGQITAVGIVGTDVYDKLLVLRAIRHCFPRALFFTTDLDSVFTHEEAVPYTHNMIVASHYGLSPENNGKGAAPPFRDSYQTSTYLAVQNAINCHIRCHHSESSRCKQLEVNPEDPPAKLFEIGRFRAIPILSSGDSANSTNKCQAENEQLSDGSSDSSVNKAHSIARLSWIPKWLGVLLCLYCMAYVLDVSFLKAPLQPILAYFAPHWAFARDAAALLIPLKSFSMGAALFFSAGGGFALVALMVLLTPCFGYTGSRGFVLPYIALALGAIGICLNNSSRSSFSLHFKEKLSLARGYVVYTLGGGTLLSIILAIFIIVLAIGDHVRSGGNPIIPFEGTTPWFASMIRGVIFALVVGLGYHLFRRIESIFNAGNEVSSRDSGPLDKFGRIKRKYFAFVMSWRFLSKWLLATVMALTLVSFFHYLFPESSQLLLARGQMAYHTGWIVYWLCIVANIALLVAVTMTLTVMKTTYREMLSYAKGYDWNAGHPLEDWVVVVRRLGNDTKSIGKCLIGPSVAILLTLVARHSWFDRADISASTFALAILALAIPYCFYWFSLRKVANELRMVILARIERGFAITPETGLRGQFRREMTIAMKEIQSVQDGALGPLANDWMFRAASIPFAGSSILLLWEKSIPMLVGGQ